MHSPTLDPARKTVWITGASGGIGASLARAFADVGANVVLSARSESKLTALQNTLLQQHPEQHFTVVPLDMTQPETFADAVAQVEAACGALHVLVHNAGISQRTPMLQTSSADERRVMETNFFGATHLTRAAADALQRTPGPKQLVVISSVAGLVGTPLRTAYSASKFALNGWFEAAEVELHDLDIGVTMVFPGFVRTDIAKNAVGGGDGDADIAAGLDPDVVARRIVHGVAARKRRITIAGKEGLAPWLRMVAPGMLLRTLLKRFRESQA